MKHLFTLMAALLAAFTIVSGAAEAQDGYRIQPGDVLRIEVLEDPGLNRSALVSPDGRVAIPLSGPVAAAGRTVEQVQAALADQISDNFAVTPNVFVTIERLAEREARLPAAPATIDVFVMGEAAKPGRITLAPGTTVLQLFAEVGGFSKFAATKRIQLRRLDPKAGKENIHIIDYKAIERGTSMLGSTVLADGDVIVIPQRGLFE